VKQCVGFTICDRVELIMILEERNELEERR